MRSVAELPRAGGLPDDRRAASPARWCCSRPSRGERADPLLVTQRYGRGATWLLGTASTWRWQMRLPLEDQRHETVLAAVAARRWPPPRRRRCRCSPSAACYEDDSAAVLEAEVLDEAFKRGARRALAVPPPPRRRQCRAGARIEPSGRGRWPLRRGASMRARPGSIAWSSLSRAGATGTRPRRRRICAARTACSSSSPPGSIAPMLERIARGHGWPLLDAGSISASCPKRSATRAPAWSSGRRSTCGTSRSLFLLLALLKSARMVAATALEAVVSRLHAWLRARCWRACALAGRHDSCAATQVLVVAGLGGEAGVREALHAVEPEGGDGLRNGHGRCGARGAAGRRRRDARSDAGCAAERQRRSCAQAISSCWCCSATAASMATNIASTSRGRMSPARELLALLDRIPATVPQLVVNATSTSGAIAERWARPHRVVITATRSGGERNATRFGAFWAEALTSEEADRDKDGDITAQEAYDLREPQGGRCLQGRCGHRDRNMRASSGNEPSRFVVARLGAAAQFASDAQLIAMRKQQGLLEQRLGRAAGAEGAVAAGSVLQSHRAGAG